MKKWIFILFLYFYSIVSYADIPRIELDGISIVNLNHFMYNSLGVSGNSSGAYSSGQCSIIIRTTGSQGAFGELAKRLKFTRTIGGQTSKEFVPVVTNFGIIVALTKTDFGLETINMVTRDGSTIGFTVSELFPNDRVEVMTGPCYPAEIKE